MRSAVCQFSDIGSAAISSNPVLASRAAQLLQHRLAASRHMSYSQTSSKASLPHPAFLLPGGALSMKQGSLTRCSWSRREEHVNMGSIQAEEEVKMIQRHARNPAKAARRRRSRSRRRRRRRSRRRGKRMKNTANKTWETGKQATPKQQAAQETKRTYNQVKQNDVTNWINSKTVEYLAVSETLKFLIGRASA